MLHATVPPQVLIVDDLVDSCNYLRRALNRLGVRAVSAYEPAQARALAEEMPFDLAFLDLWFPEGADGFDLARTLTGLSKPVPSVALSGDLEKAMRLRAFTSGMIGFRYKPCSIPELAQDIQLCALKSTALPTPVPAPVLTGLGRVLLIGAPDGLGVAAAAELQGVGFEVHTATSLRSGLYVSARFGFDVVLMAYGPGDDSTLEAIASFKGQRPARPPIVIAVVEPWSPQVEESWLAQGADECMATAEMDGGVIVRRLCRRLGITVFGKRFALDEQKRRVIGTHGPSEELSPRDIALLRLLASAGGQRVSRDAIAHHVLDGESAKDCQLRLNELMMRLREKLPANWASAIETIHGVGYSLRLPQPD